MVFVAHIPKTPSGKVQKPILRDAYLDGRILP
jgi:acyl-coenzyme A synthetase/AMP-(fatty) acid ligase